MSPRTGASPEILDEEGMTTNGLVGWLSRLSLRSEIGDIERNAILALDGLSVSIEGHRDIWRFGDATGHMHLIETGIAARFLQNSSGDRQIVSLHLPGDIVDLSALDGPLATELTALTPVTVTRLPKRAIINLTKTHPAVAAAIRRDLSADMAMVAQTMLRVGRGSAATRLAYLLCLMAVRSRLAENCDSPDFALPLTQQQIADATGLTAVHVNRVLRNFREGGLALFAHGRVTILDWSRLCGLAEFSPRSLDLPDTTVSGLSLGWKHSHTEARAQSG